MTSIKYRNVETGEIDRVFKLHQKQDEFYRSKSRFPLYSGGFGAGKTMPMVQKILIHLQYPDNLGLLGRKTLKDLNNSIVNDFIRLCPPMFIKKFVADKGFKFTNGSELLLAHFDALSAGDFAGMNLGFFAIDQAEEIDEGVFDALDGRLRRDVQNPKGMPAYIHQGMMTSNPVLFWAYKRYKQEAAQYDDNGNLVYELFESSTLDNRANLPRNYVESLLRHPESWKRQFVYGVWDETLLAGSAYFPIEYIQEQQVYAKQPIRTFEGIKIYREVEFDDEYQVGVDPSEGVVDSSPIVVVSKKRAEVVAVWHGKQPPDTLAHKVAQVGRIYRMAKVIPEMNSVGYATVAKLRDLNYGNIYVREELDSISKKKVEKYGWRTTYSSKVLLLDNLMQLLRLNKLRLFDSNLLSEMKTFIWTDESKKNGVGAAKGFHDDLIMATALALWGIKGEYQPTELQTPHTPRGSVAWELEQREPKAKYIGHK